MQFMRTKTISALGYTVTSIPRPAKAPSLDAIKDIPRSASVGPHRLRG